MARTRFKWKCIFFSSIILFNVFTKSLPINTRQLYSVTNTDTVFRNSETPVVTEPVEEFAVTYSDTIAENKNVTNEVPVNATRDFMFRKDVRPGQEIRSYALEITVNGDSFEGRAVLDVVLTHASREDDIILHAKGLDFKSVKAGVFSAASAVDADFNPEDDTIVISPAMVASSYIVIIEYSGKLATNTGRGLYLGRYDEDTYLAMNLHPTYARRVFPCMDEPTELSIMSFTFNNVDYTHMVSNSMLEENSATQFQPLQGPPHLWGMIAHNFININIPITNVLLFGRAGITNQESRASVAINSFYTNLNEWTNKPFLEIVLNQDGRMNIIALPDVSTDWNALSTVGIWEPYVFMEPVHAIKQRIIALPKIAEAMAKQWFGYVIFPRNWRYEWVVSGLASYAGWEMLRMLEGDGTDTNANMLDVNTLFVTEVIQESLLRDSFVSSRVLEPPEDLFGEDQIRDHIHVNGILKYKAPALLRMMRIVLGGADTDFIQSAAKALLTGRALQTVDSLSFVDAVNSEWLSNNNGMIGDFDEYLDPWLVNNGYPLLRVTLIRGTGVFLTQERFGFSSKPFVPFLLPITYTTSTERNFGADKIYPIRMFEQSQTLDLTIDDDDWILFNIQGQGYYRVNYDPELWDRIIEALEEPERREQIHPLNRATLVDDSLNLARAGKIDYEIALRIVLTMEHETEYAVWKAYVRNMEFLRKRLVAYVDDDEDLDPDIYLRMVRRTIRAFEDNIGFYPEINDNTAPTMETLTRGLVMEHACKANYQPCIAAAVDWFYDPNNNGVVNPNIPHEIRPAVYCTMVKQGGNEVIEALEARLAIEPTHYERVVILESLACSQNGDFINGLLERTIAADSPYVTEERVKIFAAVAESSFANAELARVFINRRTSEVINMYGGLEKLEEAIFILANNMADEDQSDRFRIWVRTQDNGLDDSQVAANRAVDQVFENLIWDARDKEYVYNWIDENHAPTLVVSVMAFCVSLIVGVLNH